MLRIAGEIASRDAAAWSLRAYDRWLPEQLHLPPPRRRLWCRYLLWPNLVLDAYPDQLAVLQILPLAPGETLVRETAYALPDAARDARLARYLNRRVRRRFAAADRRTAERMQAGIETGDYSPGPLAADDPGVRWHVGTSALLDAGGDSGVEVGSRRSCDAPVTVPSRRAGRLAAAERGKIVHILMISDVFFPRVNGVSTSIATFRGSLQASGTSAHSSPALRRRRSASAERASRHRPPGPDGPGGSPDAPRVAAARARRDIDPDGIDIVHIQTPFVAHAVGVPWARRNGLPVVETYHTHFEEYFQHYLPFLPAGLRGPRRA